MAQKLIEKLQAKNKHLEEELQTYRDLFNNLTEEKDIERHDDRRSFMLKAQIYQLERQCMLLSQAQSSRAQVLTEIENQLIKVTGFLQQTVSEKSSGPTIPMNRSKLMELVGILQKLKNSLYKQSSMESNDSLRIPSMMSGSKYLKSCEPIDCFDVCRGETEHINLKQVAGLEQDLAALNSRLFAFKAFLSSIPNAKSQNNVSGGEITPSTVLLDPIMTKVQKESNQCISDLTHCCNELMSLSLLYPSAPWAALRKSKSLEMRPEKVIQSFPPGAQKNRQVFASVNSICKVHNYLNHMNDLKLNAVKLQLSYHKAIFTVQMEYLNNLYSCITETFNDTEKKMIQSVCNPVSAILDSWLVLKENQSSENLKIFLGNMKQQENQLKIISNLQVTEQKSFSGNGSILINFKDALNSALESVKSEYKPRFTEAEMKILQHEQKMSE